MSVLRRIGWAAAAIVGPLAVFAVAMPYLVDAEAYKPALIQAVKEATGRELVIEGPMKLTILPTLRVSAQRVRFANAPGAKGAQMVDVRWVGATPSWWALLRGRVEVERLTLYQPVIVLETDAEGVPNWEFKPGAGAAQPEGAPAEGLHLTIGRLRIVKGTLSYTNPQTGQVLNAEEVEATASVGSFQGPLSIVGKATVNGVPLSLDFSLSEARPGGHDTSFSLQVQNGKLGFKGHVSELNAKAELKGQLTVSTGGLTDFVATMVRASGQPQPAFDASVEGEFTFDGGIELTPTRLAIDDFRLTMGTETASGSLALDQGPSPSLKGRVALPKVDLEKWLALLARPDAFRPPAPAMKALATAAKTATRPPATAAQPTKTPTPAKPASLSPFPTEMDVSLALDVAEILYRKGTVRDLAVALEIHKGVITVPQLKALLPGEMLLQATAASAPPAIQQAPNPAARPATKPASQPAAKPQADTVQARGEVSIAGPRLRETLTWLEIDVSGVPPDKLQRLDLRGTLAATDKGMQVADLVAELDGERATGTGSVTFGVPFTALAIVQADRFDLDAYMPTEPTATQGSPAMAAAEAAVAAPLPAVASLTVPAAPPLPDKATPIFGLKAKVAKLTFRGQALGGVEGDASVQGNLLKLNAFKVADLLGAKLDGKGTVTDFGTDPRFDFTFNATMPDADKVIDYVGLPTFLNGKVGQASASGGVVGTMKTLALRNTTVTMLGTTARITGGLALGRNFRFDFPSFNLQTQEASRLLAVATGRPQATGIGAMSVAGAFKGDAQRVVFDGNLTALGTPMTGRIDATLGARPNITANLRVPGTLDVDRWLGVSAAPSSAAAGPVAAAPGAASAPSPTPAAAPIPVGPARAATGKPVDLSALRSFDASLNLETSAVEVGSLKVTYADMEAKLGNGLFTISKLTGQFFGGAVDFNGTIDATKKALAIDFRGSLQGIYFAEMLRGAAGTNIFGNDHLTVSIDGKINITDISIQGGGVSPEEIRNSLTGRGQVSGSLYPAVAKGSLGFASFATGLGSIFSTEMGFNAAVLSGFINQQSTVIGEIFLAKGTVSLRNHTVQGLNAIARITSNNSLVAATTDTVITLDTGVRGPVDYVFTVKGPIAAPSMSTRGGN